LFSHELIYFIWGVKGAESLARGWITAVELGLKEEKKKEKK